MKVKVKICGIKTLEAAKVAIAEGADFIGFNFVSTSRHYIDPQKCQQIIDKIKGRVYIVGVFQNSSFKKVNAIAKQLNLDLVQLHGDEDDAYINEIKFPVIKSINEFQKFNTLSAPFLLIDRKQQGQGKMVDINFAKSLKTNKKFFFAGGLTPDSVASVVRQIRPFGVDVAGGIETNGKEDLHKIALFISNAKGVTI